MNGGLVFADARGAAWLAALDPRVKLAWLAWVSTLSVLLDRTPSLAALALLAAVPLAAIRMRAFAWLIVVGLLVALVWSTLLSQALFYAELPRTVLLWIVPPLEWGGRTWQGLSLSWEGAAYGLAQSLRLLAVMMSGLAVCLSTSPERLLAALARLRVPMSVGFTTVTALRFLPLLIDELVTVRRARRLRGYRASWLGLPKHASTAGRAGFRGATAIVFPVLAASLRRATTLAASVASRGFDPLARRTYYPPLRLRWSERLFVAALAATWLAVVSVKLAYWLYLAEIFYRPWLRGAYDFSRTWL